MIQYQTSRQFTEIMLAKPLVESLDQYYPDFSYWFVNRCLPGIVTGKDFMITAKHKEHLIGVALCKRAETENKLRCIRVLPEYQSRGIGLHLIDRSLRLLQHDRPLATVSEEMFHQYARVFVNRYAFTLSEVRKGMYRKHKLEYLFNA